MEKNKKEPESNRNASFITDDIIAETIYDPQSSKTKFAVFENGSVSYKDFVQISDEKIYPLDARSDLVRKRVVLLPSEASEYVSEDELIKAVRAFIHKYLDISTLFEEMASYYVLLSWMYDKFNELPYLRAIGDTGTGKSRFLITIGSICYRPIFAGGATTSSPLFRIIDKIKGTLVIDEADFRSSELTTDIVKILNTGFQKDMPVLRSEGKGVFEVKAFDVFSPKIIATRETFNDKALESRFLIEEMGHGTLRQDIPIRLADEFRQEALEIRNRLLMWRFKNYRKELKFDDQQIKGLNPRLNQIIIPLLTIIESKEMKQSLIDFAFRYSKELAADRGLSWEAEIVYAIFKIQKEETTDRMTIKAITQKVNNEAGLEEDDLKTRKVGWILRSKLHLKTYRANNGYTLSFSQNKQKLDDWKNRFAISDKDIQGEQVNDVNIDDKDEGLTAKDVGF